MKYVSKYIYIYGELGGCGGYGLLFHLLIFVAFMWFFAGINGGMALREGVDASGRKGKVCAWLNLST